MGSESRSMQQIIDGVDADRSARVSEHMQAAMVAFLGNEDAEATIDPVEALRTLTYLRGIMAEQAHAAVDLARGGGIPWADLAGPLGLDRPGPVVDAGRIAHLWAARRSTDNTTGPLVPAVAYWTCISCGQVITDHGPQHPVAIAEVGHNPACPRFEREVAEQALNFPTVEGT